MEKIMKVDLRNHFRKWLLISFFVFLLNFFGLLWVNFLLDNLYNYENVSGFIFLSLIIAGLLGIMGYLGLKIFFSVASVFNVIAIIIMLYVTYNRNLDNWNDIISMVYFLMFFGFGVLIGIAGQAWHNAKRKLN